jgi:hypothetical protein
MDDGDDRFIRKKPAGEGPVEYAEVEKKEKGNVDIPFNEYFRVRTRTGHQILLHNSEDLIYIGNARGTAWIELTSNGKIDIYAEDSISIHTENDLNFRADRDINFEAGRNVNIKAAGGKMQLESVGSVNIIAAADGKITVGAGFDLVSGSGTKLSSGGATNIKSSDTNIDGGNINLNSGLAVAATPASPLSTHTNPKTSSSSEWVNKKRYQNGTMTSIMKRIPMHEPWLLHENQAPTLLTPTSTDRDT